MDISGPKDAGLAIAVVRLGLSGIEVFPRDLAWLGWLGAALIDPLLYFPALENVAAAIGLGFSSSENARIVPTEQTPPRLVAWPKAWEEEKTIVPP